MEMEIDMKAALVILLIVLIVALIFGLGDLYDRITVSAVSGDQITETFGAEQFHLQLTAIAEQDGP